MFSLLHLLPISIVLLPDLLKNNILPSHRFIPTISFKILLIPKAFPTIPTMTIPNTQYIFSFLTLSVIPVTSSSPTSLNASPINARRSCSHRRVGEIFSEVSGPFSTCRMRGVFPCWCYGMAEEGIGRWRG